MVLSDKQLIDTLENTAAMCGTLLGVALDGRGVTDELTETTREMILNIYLSTSDTRDARGIER